MYNVYDDDIKHMQAGFGNTFPIFIFAQQNCSFCIFTEYMHLSIHSSKTSLL